MIVQGQEIAQSVIDACLARMKSGEPFAAFEIDDAARRAGIPSGDGLCMRIADRIIQRERKAGNIKLTPLRPYWKWIGAK